LSASGATSARLTGQVNEAETEVKHWRESLCTLLGVVGESSLADLVQRAEVRVRESAEIRRKRTDGELAVRQLRSNLDAAQREQRRNETDLGEWRTLWGNAIAGLPVSELADPVAVHEVVKMIDAVFAASEEMDRLQYRIDAMRADEANFIEAVRSLAIRAGRNELAENDALLAIGRLQEMARIAQTNETRATSVIGGQARERQKVSDAENAVVRYERALNELRSDAQAETASRIPDAIRANQKRLELVGRIDGHRTALAGSCGNLPLTDFVAQVSDGTRDQLFLALRLAYIENYCENTAVCPVILDDVLMAFDDERTTATLCALQELSRKTQVLVFTHHDHHVALANAALGAGGYRLHELATPSLAAA
jgi:uncharacterized protein YhaN